MPGREISSSPIASDDEEVFEVEDIKNHKAETDSRGRIKWKFLIRWKGYGPSEDTWEPKESLLPGAESILRAYIERKAAKGIHIGENGEKKHRFPKQYSRPDSRDSSAAKESSKRKKSLAAEEDEAPLKKKKQSLFTTEIEDDDEVVIPKKKSSLTATRSPTPPPAQRDSGHHITSTKSQNNIKSATPPVKKAVKSRTVSISDSELEVEEQTVPSSQTKKPEKDEVRAAPRKSIQTTVEIPAVKEILLGSLLYQKDSSWEHLLIVETLEQDSAGGYKWGVKWREIDETEFIGNEVAKRKCPQKLLEFYENHLRFKVTDPDDVVVEDGTKD